MRKAKSQRIHASRRSLERHGVWLTSAVQRDIVRQIQSKTAAVFVERQSLRITVWDVVYNERKFRVVYDSKRHTLVTVLPPPNESET
jgi:hypothetical protein